MKTLDEVIKAIEICLNNKEDCGSCPYDSIEDNRCNVWQRKSDALHYLKEYRTKQNEDFRQAYIAVRNEILFDGKDDNPPLTWEQLKQMFHKPVWIETTAKKGWNIIISIDSADMQVIHTAHRGPKLSGFSKADLGKTWQAYRKERK